MELTRAQVNLLISLNVVLQKEWNITIGYSCPYGATATEEDDYLILEERIDNTLSIDTDGEHNWQPTLWDNRDIEHDLLGFLRKTTPREFPQHEEAVERFWNKVQAALESGELYCEPGIGREYTFHGEKITVDCTLLADGRFSFKIKDDVSIYGFTRSLEQLKEEVELNKGRNGDFWTEIPEDFKPSILKNHFKDEVALKVAEEILSRSKKE